MIIGSVHLYCTTVLQVHTGRRPDYYNSTGNIYKSVSVSRKNEPHHLIVNRDKPRSEYR